MKKRLFFLWLGMLALPGWAQVTVRSRLTLSEIESKQLNRQYPPAVGPSEQATTKDMAFQKAQGDLWIDFNRFLYKNKFKPKEQASILIDGYFQANGQADLIVYRVVSDKLMAPDDEQQLVNHLRLFLETHKLSVNTTLVSSPFRLTSGYGLPSTKPRMIKASAGVVSDITTATQTNRPDTVRKVNFSGLNLESVPEVLYRFTNAEEIDLGNNSLTSLPTNVSSLPNLKRLNLMTNRLTEDSLQFSRNNHIVSINLQRNLLTRIPMSIRQNRRLESLWLGNNELNELDVSTLRRLHRLTDLNLYNVGLTQLPKSIRRLKHVKVLDLYYNKLTNLPRQVGRMKRLEQLAVAHNDLTTFPESLARLGRLQVLFAHHNRISQLPVEFQRLHNLRVLDLGYNWFTVTPDVLSTLPSLEELDLNNNNLQELRPSLGELKNLKRLYLRSNPLSHDNLKTGPYAPLIQQLETNRTEVFY